MLRPTKVIRQIVVFAGALCWSCTTASNGRYETIHVMSDSPGALASIACDGATHAAEGIAPADLRVLRKADGCLLRLTAKDHRQIEIPLRRFEIADRVSAKRRLLEGAQDCLGDAEAAAGCVVFTLAIGLPIAGVADWIDNLNLTGGLYEHKPNRPFVRFSEIETNTFKPDDDSTAHLSTTLRESVSEPRATSVSDEIFTFSPSRREDYSRVALARIVR